MEVGIIPDDDHTKLRQLVIPSIRVEKLLSPLDDRCGCFFSPPLLSQDKMVKWGRNSSPELRGHLYVASAVSRNVQVYAVESDSIDGMSRALRNEAEDG